MVSWEKPNAMRHKTTTRLDRQDAADETTEPIMAGTSAKTGERGGGLVHAIVSHTLFGQHHHVATFGMARLSKSARPRLKARLIMPHAMCQALRNLGA